MAILDLNGNTEPLVELKKQTDFWMRASLKRTQHRNLILFIICDHLGQITQLPIGETVQCCKLATQERNQ